MTPNMKLSHDVRFMYLTALWVSPSLLSWYIILCILYNSHTLHTCCGALSVWYHTSAVVSNALTSVIAMLMCSVSNTSGIGVWYLYRLSLNTFYYFWYVQGEKSLITKSSCTLYCMIAQVSEVQNLISLQAVTKYLYYFWYVQGEITHH